MFQDIFRGESHESLATSYQANAAFAFNNAIELKNSERATLVRLNRNFVDDMLALQDRETTGNTIKRSRKDVETLFDRNDVVFGIVTKSGELIAQSVLRLDTKLPEILCDKFNAAASHAIIGCVMVDPAYTGQGLAPLLIQKCVNEARDRGADFAHARILEGNGASMHNFHDKFGFNAATRGQSPEATQPRIVDFMVLKLGN